jgi:hypothetical protein
VRYAVSSWLKALWVAEGKSQAGAWDIPNIHDGLAHINMVLINNSPHDCDYRTWCHFLIPSPDLSHTTKIGVLQYKSIGYHIGF